MIAALAVAAMMATVDVNTMYLHHVPAPTGWHMLIIRCPADAWRRCRREPVPDIVYPNAPICLHYSVAWRHAGYSAVCYRR